MPDNTSYAQHGIEIIHSIAEKTENQLAISVLTGGTVGTIYSGVTFILGILNWLQSDNTVAKALASLQKQINDLSNILGALAQRLDELEIQVAIESNRATLRSLTDYLAHVQTVASNFQNVAPGAPVGNYVAIANEAGILLDRFLDNDLDIWCWADVVQQPHQQSHDVIFHRFKNVPTLPVYILALFTWLTAREKVVQMNANDRLQGDGPRLTQHLAAVSSRPLYDAYGDDRFGPPVSIAENIQWQIQSSINSVTQYPQNGTCKFYFKLTNWMDGKKQLGGDFERTAASANALCTIDPATVSKPAIEIDMEGSEGLSSLQSIEDTLRGVQNTGSLRQQQIGNFNPSFLDSFDEIYAVGPDGALFWYQHIVIRTGGPGSYQYSHQWAGPRRVGAGWQQYTNLIPGGYRCLYALTPAGELHWYQHVGHTTGGAANGDWKGPINMGSGWNQYDLLIGGGDGVIYGADFANNNLVWNLQQGYDDGTPGWQGPQIVWNQWDPNMETRAFSAGGGVLYTVRRDGGLHWSKHTGYLTGAANWQGWGEISPAWDSFKYIFAAEGSIYAVTSQGDLIWYKYLGYADGSNAWVGPVTLGSGWEQFRIVFAQLRGGHPHPIR